MSAEPVTIAAFPNEKTRLDSGQVPAATNSSKLVLRHDQVETGSVIGGKAWALWQLGRAELPVPPWLVVLPDAFYESLAEEERAQLERAKTESEVQEILTGLVLTGATLEALRLALDQVCPDKEAVAVRSSALEEDSAVHSFAGQLESYLFVDAADVPDRVARVWRSAFSERIIAYRRQAGLRPLPGPPCVLIQRMVASDVSGVAFSADPVSGRRGVAVVGAVWGLASSLVSGEADADTWRVDREGRIVSEELAPKTLAHRRDKSIEGVRTVPLTPELAARPALDERQVCTVADLARRAEAFFGRPQDIEWAMEGDRLYLIQSRPITTLADKADPDGVRAIWDNANIVESYSGITTPFTFSFARRAYEEVYRTFCRLMGVPESVIEDQRQMFQRMLGMIRGRVYYNLLNWYRLVAMLPGFQVNRKFMEQMMGVRESVPDEVLAGVDNTSTGSRLRNRIRFIRSLWGLAVNFMLLDRRISHFYERLNDALGTSRPDLSSLRPDELVRYYRNIEQRLITRWDAPIINDFATMFFYGILRRLVVSWLGDSNGTLQNDLLSGDSGMISGEPARRLREMAQIAITRPQLVQSLCEDPLHAIKEEIRCLPPFEEAYRFYLDRFGDRCLEELKLESKTLHDDPMPLLRSVGQCAAALRAGKREQTQREPLLRREAEAKVHAVLRRHPLRRLLFGWVLRNACATVRSRENLRFERTRVFGRARLIAVELGKRLAALDRLNDPRDIFYLEVDEVLEFVEGSATTTDFKGLVALRKKQFDAYRADPPPAERFETRGIVYVGHTFTADSAHARPEGQALQGIGCCPGIIRGPVRLIREPRDARLEPGEIVVAERTDPGWVMIFPSASGLLVERGSLLSHSAIVAREIGLPTVVGLMGLMAWLRDGDWVEMDGSTGSVTKVPAP